MLHVLPEVDLTYKQHFAVDTLKKNSHLTPPKGERTVFILHHGTLQLHETRSCHVMLTLPLTSE